MRVSDKLIYSQIVQNLQKNSEKLLRIQTQLASGKKIEAPSDDPIRHNQILTYNSMLTRLDQYTRNIDFGTGSLGLSDGLLSQVSGLLVRAKELAVEMRSDTNTADDRAVAAKKMRQLLLEMVGWGNTRDGAGYLYSGNTVRGRYTGTEVTFPITVTAATNDTLQVEVNGVSSGTVTLTPGGYATGSALAAEVETQINADAALGTNDVSVTFDSIGNCLVILSQDYGETSSADVVGGTARSTLGLSSGTSTQGTRPFTLATATRDGDQNTGGAVIDTGRVTDESRTTQDDYVIKFTSPALYDIYRVSTTASAIDVGATPSNASVTQSSVVDTGRLTLDTYEIQFTSTSPTEYSIVDTTKGVTLSSGNTYASGEAIEFDGLRMVLTDGAAGGPVDGDIFRVDANGVLVSGGNAYTSGAAIDFDGLQVEITNGASAPAADDAFAIQTRYVFNGDTNDRRIGVGESAWASAGMSGGDLFSGVLGGTDILSVMKNLYNSLMGNNPEGMDSGIRQLDEALDQATSAQAEVGARINYLDTTFANLEAFKLNIAILKSGIEDVDFAQAASELVFQQTALEATQGASARLMQSSLLDFLR
ncbi:MAG: flagellar hook-associated protein FlgL [Nitrospirae bacterium]|nr:flagellar hook-associated protein FlgL [Nitrospirota bacterium]